MGLLARFIFRLLGWKVVGTLPGAPKYILIVAPHTSNWDLVIGLLARFGLGVQINFLAKKQLFFFPLSWFLRALGGISVDRSKPGHLVNDLVALYQAKDSLRLGLAPEGTRSAVSRWKEGFYHIACQARVPIVLVGFDYPSKEVRIGPVVKPKGEIEKDFETILSFYRTITGKYPKVIPVYVPKPKV
jgi:1-acyl-sn-glycerol-3-phosphate acyltransferase